MKVLAVIGLAVLARGWGLRRGAWYWLLWPVLAVDTGYLALMVALH